MNLIRRVIEIWSSWSLSSDPDDWVDWLGLIVGSVIAALAVRIAFGQTQIQRSQLRHELYDRRLAVYQAVTELTYEVIREAELSAERYRRIVVARSFADFVYDEPIVRYLETLESNARQMRELALRERRAQEHDDQVGIPTFTEKRIADRAEFEKILQWFASQPDPQKQLFTPYFKIREKPAV